MNGLLSICMKVFPAVLSIVLLGIFSYLAYGFDQWVGMMAYTLPYLIFCLIAAAVIGAAWIPLLNKRAYVAGLVAFAALSVHLLLPPPSERILRSALMQMPAGTSADSIEGIVQEAYKGSPYSLPEITRETNRIHVSLIHQEPGNCTSLTIHLKDGRVVGSEYVPD